MEGEGRTVKEEEENFCPTQGVSVVIFTAKGAKIANKKGSVPCRSEAVPGRERGKENGVSPVVFGLTKRKCPL